MHRYSLIFLLILGACPVFAEPKPSRKLLATGWDSPTPAEFRQHLREFEQAPFDGTTIFPVRKTSEGRFITSADAFQRDQWSEDCFDQTIADLQAATPQSARENFLMIYANPGDIDWFDDEGWAEIVDHWRLLARAAKRGGLRGLSFDTEPYHEPWSQFRYSVQPQRKQHSFADYRRKARERGREVMRALKAEFPEAVIFAFRLVSDLLPVLSADGDPSSLLEGETFGLLPAFLEGWFDEIPATMKLIEGNEAISYRANSAAEFDRAFTALRTSAFRLFAPEHSTRFRTQLLISHGLYLDAYANPRGSNWYIDSHGSTPTMRFAKNLDSAFRASDSDWIWIYGESARWWPSRAGQPERPMWPKKLPGIIEALRRVKDPQSTVQARLATAKAEENLLKNSDFSAVQPNKLPAHWTTWQSEQSHGIATRDPQIGKGAACWSAAQDACFIQQLPVKADELFATSLRVRTTGAGTAVFRIRWKDANGKWTAEPLDIIVPAIDDLTDDWKLHAGLIQVPENATLMVILLHVLNQSEATDHAWFDDAMMVRM